jgi:hypothetical protein
MHSGERGHHLVATFLLRIVSYSCFYILLKQISMYYQGIFLYFSEYISIHYYWLQMMQVKVSMRRAARQSGPGGDRLTGLG